MPKVSDILAHLDSIAPTQYAMSYDNVGLLVGNADVEVSKILVALDITDAVINEAVRLKANLIVAHHPVIFGQLSRIVKGDITANRVIKLLENHISAICMHTNLDAAHQGVNDVLAEKLGISTHSVIEVLGEDKNGIYGIGRMGKIEKEISFTEFASTVMERLVCSGIRFHKASERVLNVAVGGGSCGSLVANVVRAGCDTFVTADVKHDQWLMAQELGLNLIDAGHFSTENIIVPPLVAWIKEAFSSVCIQQSEVCTQPIEYMTKLEV